MICSQLRIATGGVVTASGKGFRGGQTVLGWGGGHQGESCKGNVQQDYAANYSGVVAVMLSGVTQVKEVEVAVI